MAQSLIIETKHPKTSLKLGSELGLLHRQAKGHNRKSINQGLSCAEQELEKLSSLRLFTLR